MSIAKVEPLTTARALRGPFDYLLPAQMADVGVGSVLLVPFGRRRVLGVVVELAERSELPPGRLAEPIEALEAGVSAELVRLGLWVGSEYCSTPARGLEVVLPPGTARGGRRVAPRLELRAAITDAGGEAIGATARLGSRQRAVLEALIAARDSESSDPGGLPAPQLAAACGADRAALRRLERRGLVTLVESEARRRPSFRAIGQRPRDVKLTADQLRATEAIAAAVGGPDAGRRRFLLCGVTGSGKTEVYLAAAEAAMARGRGVVVLVPEIALTPQTVTRFRERFGDTVALLHSRLGAGARFDEWRRLRSGEARVCVGPRSAVFAPVADLGLVVVDEEHDPGYKQEGDPRYDARHVARHRAAGCDAVFVAGTATPRPESWLELERLELPERVDGGRLPAVEVVDMRGGDRRGGPLHPTTIEELDEVRRRGGKAIVLLNRRGWSPHLSCRSCGRSWGCPACDVSLVIHRREGRLVCHHCGHAEVIPAACPGCGSVTLARGGAGTERVESLLARLLDPLPVFRLDSDSAAPADSHLDILDDFERAPGGVLVGTQMVAKGHDFAGVSLGVVLDADAALRFPDFRAEERTFALVSQLAGRVGRGEGGGRVLLQTLTPHADAIRAAARHDAAGFVTAELGRRRALRYPPFSNLVRIEVAGPDAAGVERDARRIHGALATSLPAEVALLGPAPRFRVRGRHRRQLLLKSADRGALVSAVRESIEDLAAARALGSALSVDVDPQ
jgi:primosomal protein N' (replication factor Y) (superfamily II helicase)